MKRRTWTAGLVGAATIMFGCGETDPVSPFAGESELTPFLAAAQATAFVAAVDLTAPPVAVAEIRVTDGVLHVRGQVNEGPITGAIVGTATTVIDIDIVQAKGDGTGRGTFVFETADGAWEGRFEGRATGALFEGHIQGHGRGGLAGKKLRGTFTDQAVDNVFVVTGTILDPNAQ